MSKSIKFGNNTYLDSSGITHKQKLLSDVLNSKLDKKDLNTIVGVLVIGYGNDCINKPATAGNGYFINIPHSYYTGYDKQIFMPRTNHEVYMRNRERGTFSEWVKIL